MKKNQYVMKVRVWIYQGQGAWHFVTLPKKYSREISKRFDALKRGWGSLQVIANIGTTKWKTSIFPDSKRGAYLLPLKADVRKKECLSEGDTITVSIEICV